MAERKSTREVRIGDVVIGGNHPIAIQSMTNTKTQDVEATVAQILQLERAGCQIIRSTVPDMEAAKALQEIKKQIHIPLVADIHFDYRLAIAAIENGADKIRINPALRHNVRRGGLGQNQRLRDQLAGQHAQRCGHKGRQHIQPDNGAEAAVQLG